MYKYEDDFEFRSARAERHEALAWHDDALKREVTLSARECDERIREYSLGIWFSLREAVRDTARLGRAVYRRAFLWLNT